MTPGIKPNPSSCANCVAELKPGEGYPEPLGKDGALVTVCLECSSGWSGREIEEAPPWLRKRRLKREDHRARVARRKAIARSARRQTIKRSA